MNRQNRIDRLRTGSIIILILIVLFLSKCISDINVVKPVQENKIELIDTTDTAIPTPNTIFVENPVDTIGIINYCVKNGLYQELFPKKVVTKTKIIKEEPETELEQDKKIDQEQAQQIDTVFTTNTVEVPSIPVLDFGKKEERISPFIGMGINTFPSISLMAGAMFDNKWGVAIEGTCYFYSGVIENAVVPNDVNVFVNTRKTRVSEAPEIGYVEIPTFSIGLKVIKKF